MKLMFWLAYPEYYRKDFLSAVRKSAVDFKVCYYKKVPQERIAMGWDTFRELPPDEMYISNMFEAFEKVPDWRDRVHIVPSYVRKFTLKLALKLSSSKVPWVHWREPSQPGLSWWLTYPVKLWYGRMANKYSLGAFGIGILSFKDFIRWGIRVERIAVLPYSGYPCHPVAEPDTACEEFRRGRTAFLFLGNLCRRKGVDLLLKAFEIVASTSDTCVLILAGNDHSNGYYRRMASSLGISKQVLFRGPVEYKSISNVLRCAKVLVLPSRFDGWGYVLNEAASMGLALIATDRCGAAYHIIEPGENGFRVKAGSVRSLARAMSAYASDPELIYRHGQHSLNVFDQFTPESTVESFLAILHTWQSTQ